MARRRRYRSRGWIGSILGALLLLALAYFGWDMSFNPDQQPGTAESNTTGKAKSASASDKSPSASDKPAEAPPAPGASAPGASAPGASAPATPAETAPAGDRRAAGAPGFGPPSKGLPGELPFVPPGQPSAGIGSSTPAPPHTQKPAVPVLTKTLPTNPVSRVPEVTTPPSVSPPPSVGGPLIGSNGPTATPETITVATFNLQSFGEVKAGDPDVIRVLRQTLQLFDVVAVQEIRAQDPEFFGQFVETLRGDGQATFRYIMSPRLGRSGSKEQYAFVYNSQRVEMTRGSAYTVYDPTDYLQREPLVATFRALAVAPERAFTFTLINVHTDPEEARIELNVLDDVFDVVQQQGEDDVLMLGDLNVDDQHLGQLGKVPHITSVTANLPAGTKTYDHLLYCENTTVEFTGRAGVLDLRRTFQLTEEQLRRVSEHPPVWAEFHAVEGRSIKVAARPVP